jgi:hypothetical protein
MLGLHIVAFAGHVRPTTLNTVSRFSTFFAYTFTGVTKSSSCSSKEKSQLMCIVRCTEQLVRSAALLKCIREGLGSNLGLLPTVLAYVHLYLSSVPPGKCQETAASVTSFTVHYSLSSRTSTLCSRGGQLDELRRHDIGGYLRWRHVLVQSNVR